MSGNAKTSKSSRRRKARQNRRETQKVVSKKSRPFALVVTPNARPKPARSRAAKNAMAAAPSTTAVASGNGAYRLTGDVSWGIPGIASGRLGGFLSDGVASGSGAYKVKSNSLMNHLDLTGTVPKVKNLQNGEAFVISHREYIKDIRSGAFEADTELTSFNLEAFVLNPANRELFPWLSQLAGNFQEYKVTGMLVEFKTTSSDLSTTLSLGAVIMTADYNVLADEPLNKQLMENMENAGSCKPSCSLIMPIECKPSLTSISTHLFVGPLDAEDGDKRLYDMCKIYIATAGIPKEAVSLGELWVTYEIAFYKPKLIPFPVQQDNLSWQGFWTDATTANPMPEPDFHLANHSSDLFTAIWAPDGKGAIKFPAIPGQKFLFFAYFFDSSGGAAVRGIQPALLSVGVETMQFQFTATNYQGPGGENAGATYTGMTTTYILNVTNGPEDATPYVQFDDDGTFNTSQLHVCIAAWNRDYTNDDAPDTDIWSHFVKKYAPPSVIGPRKTTFVEEVSDPPKLKPFAISSDGNQPLQYALGHPIDPRTGRTFKS